MGEPSQSIVPRQQSFEQYMPARRDAPYGLSVLNRMHYRAMEQESELQARAYRALANRVDGETQVVYAVVRREVAREQLRNIDEITGDERDRILFARDARARREIAAAEEAQIGQLKRELERTRLEMQIERLRRPVEVVHSAAPMVTPPPPSPPDRFTKTIDTLGRIPDLVDAMKKAKERIVTAAGGEANVSEAVQDLFAAMEAIVESSVSRVHEGSEV